MTTSGAELFAAILDNPEDTPRRLVYADWLEEQGQAERAEFIRLQCRLADLPHDAPEFSDLSAREAEMLEAYGPVWLRDLPLTSQSLFRRGFVEYVATHPAGFLAAAPALFAATPLRLLQLIEGEPDSSPPGWADRLAVLPELSRLRCLDLSACSLAEAELRPILSSPHLGPIEAFRFNDANCNHETARLLAGNHHLTHLRSLEFFGYQEGGIGDAGCVHLAGASHLRSLEVLDLRDNAVGPAGAEALAASAHLDNLRVLYLGDGHYSPNDIGPRGLAALAGSPQFARLERLHLDFNGVGDRGVTSLARSPHLRSLRVLTLVGNGVGVAGVEALAGSEVLRTIEELDLSGIQSGDRGVSALARSPNVRRLRTLSLQGAGMTERGLAQFAQAPWVADLTDLRLSGNNLGDNGVRLLCQSDAFRRLRRLRLDQHTFRKSEPVLRQAFGDRLDLEMLVLPSMYSSL